jgi:hypothetical protein
MGESEKEKVNKDGSSSAGVTKWIVFGVISLVFLFLFRSELGQLLGRVSEVKITKEGVELKTAETPLGNTVFSNVLFKPGSTPSAGVHGATFVSQRSNFEISWPDNVNWTASEEMGRDFARQLGLPSTVDIPIVIRKNEAVANFQANVNVVVEQINSMTIQEYMNRSVATMSQMGWQILSTNVDESTQGGLIVLLNTMNGNQIYQFQRYAIAAGRAYIITASQLPPDNLLTQQLRDDLRSILNSFRVIG